MLANKERKICATMRSALLVSFALAVSAFPSAAAPFQGQAPAAGSTGPTATQAGGDNADTQQPTTSNVGNPGQTSASPESPDNVGTENGQPSQGRANGTNQTAGPAQATRTNGQNPNASKSPTPKTQINRRQSVPPDRNNGIGVQQNPYIDVPALNDLYKQSLQPDFNAGRFGISIFQNGAANEPASAEGAVAADYILGPGDTIGITTSNGLSLNTTRVVDREGRISLPDIEPVPVAGQTLAGAQTRVEQALHQEYNAVRVDLTIAKLRTTRVYVVGEVQHPGVFNLSGNSTALTALMAAGGPTDEGSLRRVEHMRDGSVIGTIDFYNFLLKGVRSELQPFANGDTLLVPPVGPEVTIVGAVLRPATFELLDENKLADVLRLAGGVSAAGTLQQITVERIDPHRKRYTMTVNFDGTDAKAGDFKVESGDRIAVNSILPYREQTVYLQGHVYRPGTRGFEQGMTVKSLIPSYADLLPEPADRFEITRLQPPTYRPIVIPLELSDVLEHGKDFPLQPFDTVRIFGRYERDNPHVSIEGQVMRPGQYPMAEGMTAAQLVRLAGGLRDSAFAEIADLASYEIKDGQQVETTHQEIRLEDALNGEPDVVLKSGDVLGIREKSGWQDIGSTVTISGEVRFPSTLGITNGERLSSLIERVGGFTDLAYPYGAVLQRPQVLAIEEHNREELIRQLQQQTLTTESARSDDASQKKAADMRAMREKLIGDLQNAAPSGRLVVRISRDIQKWRNTSDDIVLRPGDQITIPKSADFVLINGQVYNPNAISYSHGKSAEWYLRAAGGPTRLANRRDIFIIRANGIVVSAGGRGLFHSVLGTTMLPGDTIVVPQRVESGTDVFKNLSVTAQLLAALAIAARVATP